jgi:hypothetical protein
MSEKTDPRGEDFCELDVPSSTFPAPMSRRMFMETAAIAGASLATLSMSAETPKAQSRRSAEGEAGGKSERDNAIDAEDSMAEEIVREKIRRARLAGPDCVTKEATVAEMDAYGKLTVLQQGTNQWVCIPGNENIVGQADMCLDPMGMVFWLDLLAKKPKPTNIAPGLIYMLNGATQRSYTDPFDRTSSAIPIGPHWMILWPFDAKLAGLPTVMRDGGTMVMFAGTPYAHLHVCGSPWDGNEYHSGDRAVRTLTYARP